MSLFDAYSREQLRKAYADAWAKHLAHVPLTAPVPVPQVALSHAALE